MFSIEGPEATIAPPVSTELTPWNVVWIGHGKNVMHQKTLPQYWHAEV